MNEKSGRLCCTLFHSGHNGIDLTVCVCVFSLMLMQTEQKSNKIQNLNYENSDLENFSQTFTLIIVRSRGRAAHGGISMFFWYLITETLTSNFTNAPSVRIVQEWHRSPLKAL